jgi:hypothetical protein
MTTLRTSICVSRYEILTARQLDDGLQTSRVELADLVATNSRHERQVVILSPTQMADFLPRALIAMVYREWVGCLFGFEDVVGRLSQDEQAAKLRRVVTGSHSVWGGVTA